MRPRAAILALSLALAASEPVVSGGRRTGGMDATLEGIRPEALRAHLEFLADDLLEGRGTGTRGYDIAARYVASLFQAAGLEPGGADGTYFQPVPLRKADLVPEESSLSLQGEGGTQELVYGRDFLMGGDTVATESHVTAPLAYVGFGITAPELGYDDYARIDMRGKIVVMLRGAPPSFPPDQRAYYSSRQGKTERAVSHGAVGVIAFALPDDEKRFSFERILAESRHGSMSWLDDKGVPEEARSHLRGAAYFSRDAAQRLFAGAAHSLAAVEAEAAAGKARPFDLPWRAEIRTISRHADLTSRNVLGGLKGSDPALRREIVVYTAHLDHLGVGEPQDGDAIYNGAYDNASGVANLLEVARAFSRLPRPPRRSILFMAVTGEEKGLLGSDYFASHPTVPAADIVAEINMDMFLTLFPVRDVVAFGAGHSSLDAVVREAAGQMGLEVGPDPFPEQVLFVRSDQYSFVRKGVPAVMLSAGIHSADERIDGRARLLEWLRTVYHSPQDDTKQPIDYEAAARIARVNFLVGDLVAEAPTRPVWKPGDFFGKQFGRR